MILPAKCTGGVNLESSPRPDCAVASVRMLPVIWSVFAVLALGGFLMVAAYWLDVQERLDLSVRARIGWSAAVLLFPVSIPAYAFAGGPGWPTFLRVASLVPAVAVALFLGFVFGLFS